MYNNRGIDCSKIEDNFYKTYRNTRALPQLFRNDNFLFYRCFIIKSTYIIYPGTT